MVDAIDDIDTLTNLRRASLSERKLLGVFQPSSVPSGYSFQTQLDSGFVSLLLLLHLEPASPSYIGIGKAAVSAIACCKIVR